MNKALEQIKKKLELYDKEARYWSCYKKNGIWVFPYKDNKESLILSKWINWKDISEEDYQLKSKDFSWVNFGSIKAVLAKNNVRIFTLTNLHDKDRIQRHCLLNYVLKELNLSKDYPWVISGKERIKIIITSEYKGKDKNNDIYSAATVSWRGIDVLPSLYSEEQFIHGIPTAPLKEVPQKKLCYCAYKVLHKEDSSFRKFIKNTSTSILVALLITICAVIFLPIVFIYKIDPLLPITFIITSWGFVALCCIFKGIKYGCKWVANKVLDLIEILANITISFCRKAFIFIKLLGGTIMLLIYIIVILAIIYFILNSLFKGCGNLDYYEPPSMIGRGYHFHRY